MAKTYKYLPLAAFIILAVFASIVIAQRSSKAAGFLKKDKTSLDAKTSIGKKIFFDTSLSSPEGMSCATCHTPEKGFADTLSRMTSEGAVKGLFSNRNSMSVSYSMYVPPLHYSRKDHTYLGGLFWDGRARTLADQASKPFVNPVEMACKDDREVVSKVKKAPYYQQFLKIYSYPDDDQSIFSCITDALQRYEESSEINPFTSKFDAVMQRQETFTSSEARGLSLFEGKGKCAQCHVTTPDPKAHRPLFTDHTYDNLGIPRNEESHYYSMPPEINSAGHDYIDLGLGDIVKNPGENGKFRVPTLRNIALTAPYGHNGYFKTLEDIVHFYNVRDDGHSYPPAEYPETVNKEEMGALGLSKDEEADIVAFLKTLTDRH
jgi:cytochrome c peroxidase